VTIKESFERSHGINGSPRVHDDLLDEKQKVRSKRVARLMRDNELVARCVKAFKRTTISDPLLPYSANLLNQDFSAEAVNQRWVGVITTGMKPGLPLKPAYSNISRYSTIDSADIHTQTEWHRWCTKQWLEQPNLCIC